MTEFVLPPLAPWQEAAYARACAALDAGRLAHGLLICGPADLGKRALAERLAQRVLCERRGPGEDACGSCRGCRLFAYRVQREPLEVRPDGEAAHPFGHSGHPDLHLIGYTHNEKTDKPRGEIVIDQIRALSEKLTLTGQYGMAQVAIVDPAEAINHAACNALLKTLEEPQPGRYLWLVTAHPARLPATIRSRCQRLELHLPPAADALAWLRAQGHAEAAARDALAASRGHPGLAERWLRDGGLELRKAVAADLAALGRGEASVIETAQRWQADRLELRLRHAADLALVDAGKLGADGLTGTRRIRTLAAWFDAANRTRDLLRTTVRADLACVELLAQWRDAAIPATGGRR